MIKKKKNIKNYRKPLMCEISSGQGSTSLGCCIIMWQNVNRIFTNTNIILIPTLFGYNIRTREKKNE